jgi:hypothetical protein
VLERTAERILEYANGDRELLNTAHTLRNDVERYAEREMSGMELKLAFAEANYMVRDRMASGLARKKRI